MVVLLWARELAAQCAMCRESVAASGGDLALGFNFGILLLLGTILTLGGGLVGVIVYTAARSNTPVGLATAGASRTPSPAPGPATCEEASRSSAS